MSTSPTPPASAAGAATPPVISTHPLLGVFGVLFGAMIATCTGRLISVGLSDLRGALHLGVDEASWIGTAFNAALIEELRACFAALGADPEVRAVYLGEDYQPREEVRADA